VGARKAVAPAITDTQRAFVKASDDAETARLGKERAQLEVIRKAQEATARQQRRIAWLLGGLAVLLCGSILGTSDMVDLLAVSHGNRRQPAGFPKLHVGTEYRQCRKSMDLIVQRRDCRC
jgi:hypothetical protein